MKISLDIHGTIDADPEFFSWLTKEMKSHGTEIHITTGVPITQKLKTQLNDWGIKYDHMFSITDYHEQLGTYIEWDERGPWIEKEIWDRTKGDYCLENDIDLAIDDSLEYEKYFQTPYLLFEKGTVEK